VGDRSVLARPRVPVRQLVSFLLAVVLPSGLSVAPETLWLDGAVAFVGLVLAPIPASR